MDKKEKMMYRLRIPVEKINFYQWRISLTKNLIVI